MEDRYEKAVYHLNKLPCVYTDKFVYKPDYHNFQGKFPAGLDSLHYTGPKEVAININEESHSFDQENEDWSSRDTHWYPYLVLAHSSTTLTNREIENCVGKNQYDEVDWFSTINKFITTSMKFKLCRDTKANIFKDIVKKYAKECAFWISSGFIRDLKLFEFCSKVLYGIFSHIYAWKINIFWNNFFV